MRVFRSHRLALYLPLALLAVACGSAVELGSEQQNSAFSQGAVDGRIPLAVLSFQINPFADSEDELITAEPVGETALQQLGFSGYLAATNITSSFAFATTSGNYDFSNNRLTAVVSATSSSAHYDVSFEFTNLNPSSNSFPFGNSSNYGYVPASTAISRTLTLDNPSGVNSTFTAILMGNTSGSVPGAFVTSVRFPNNIAQLPYNESYSGTSVRKTSVINRGKGAAGVGVPEQLFIAGAGLTSISEVLVNGEAATIHDQDDASMRISLPETGVDSTTTIELQKSGETMASFQIAASYMVHIASRVDLNNIQIGDRIGMGVFSEGIVSLVDGCLKASDATPIYFEYTEVPSGLSAGDYIFWLTQSHVGSPDADPPNTLVSYFFIDTNQNKYLDDGEPMAFAIHPQGSLIATFSGVTANAYSPYNEGGECTGTDIKIDPIGKPVIWTKNGTVP